MEYGTFLNLEKPLVIPAPEQMLRTVLLLAALSTVSACTGFFPQGLDLTKTFKPTPASTRLTGKNSHSPVVARFNNREKECLVRAMYFESNRSSANGMLAVGTVVMNRVASSRFDNSICAVVGAPRQFAPGVLSRPMRESKPVTLASTVADRLLRGERHSGVRSAKFFHQAGLSFPYTNMHYVLNAGGNSFYIKSSR